MELGKKQRDQLDSRNADQAAYANYARSQNAQTEDMLADRNRRYLQHRLNGLSVDDAYEALRVELGVRSISGLDAYEDEYDCNESLADVIAFRCPELAM